MTNLENTPEETNEVTAEEETTSPLVSEKELAEWRGEADGASAHNTIRQAFEDIVANRSK
jgi:hypothetical protein